MRLALITFALSLLITATGQSNAHAAPITMTCTDDGESYNVSFSPLSRALIVNESDGFFHPKMIARRYYVKNVSPADGGYKITASGGEAGPHIIVFTGASKKVEYTESSFGFVFAVDPCR
jgi:hypothetical protein